MPLQPKSATSAQTAEGIRAILETRGLTLYQVCQRLESSYGHASPYCLPHNLYYSLRLGTFSPNLYQLFALSRVTNYRLTDWVRVFGFDLEQIPRLEVLLPAKRTILLDCEASDPNAWIPWFQDKPHDVPIPSAAPLSQLLEAGPSVRQSALLAIDRHQFLYAKIGMEDARAFPDLLPGSIARIDRQVAATLPSLNQTPSNRIFLIEHGSGLCCCRLLAAGRNRTLTVSTHLPYPQIEFELQREARILGAVDFEIRSLAGVEQPEVPKELRKRQNPVRLRRGSPTLSQLLRASRLKTGLSLREASALSRRIAGILANEHYFISPSSLSDYEASDTAPHQIEKVITLCVVYAVLFHTLLDTVGVSAAKAGQELIPDHLLSNAPPEIGRADPNDRADQGFLAELLRRCEEIPTFLRGAIAELSGVATPSLRSLFWIGGVESPLHPYLANALLASVDRRRQKPVDSRSRPPWQQTSYMILKRDGTYLCGPCGIENGTLVMHPDAPHMDLREQFRNHRDAEVVGQVAAIARRLT